MAENGDIELIITLDDGSIVRGLAAAEKQSKNTGDKIERNLGQGIGNAFKNVGKAAAVAFAAAAAGIAVAFKKGVDAAAVQEEAVNDLNAALGRTGQFTKQASEDFQAFASELQKNSTIGDEVILKNAAVLQSLGSLSTEGLKEATQAAVDLSAALGIDLNAATVLVGKAATGEVSSFSRYGLAIERGATNSETFANALSKINAQFGGAAAAKVNTYSGAVQQASNAFGDLLEEVGFLITKSPEIAALFRGNGNLIADLSKRISDFRKSGGFRELILDAIDFAKGINTFVVQPLEVTLNVFRTAISGISTIVQGVIAGFATIFSAAASGLNSILNLFGKNIDGTVELTKEFAQDTNAVFLELANQTGEQFTSIFDTAGTTASEGFLNGIRQIVIDAPPLLEEVKNNVQTTVEEIKLSVGTLGSAIADGFAATEVKVASIANTIQSKLGAGIASSFAALGGALARGENGFAAFGRTALGVLGDIAIQIGTILIAAGLGWSFIPGFQASSAAIPQGIALTVIGGALKALAGSGGGASAAAAPAASGGGGGVTDTSVSAQDVTPDADLAEDLEERKPNVTINVQGNILDRRESGLELAEIFSEAVGANAVVFQR